MPYIPSLEALFKMATRNIVGLVYNAKVPEAARLAGSLQEALELRERAWISAAGDLAGLENEIRRTSTIITVGGDGTILRTVRVAAPHSVPILGINMGRVGFMTEISVEEALQKVPTYLNGEARVEERMMLQASVVSENEEEPRLTLHVLNDIVVGRAAVAKLLNVEATVDNVPMTTYRADGVVVATATGSTAYTMSIGGPIVSPGAKVILMHPVAAHLGLRTSLVLPVDSVVELRVRGSAEAILSADGFTDASLGTGDRVVIRRSPHIARFLRAGPPSDFYANLTSRLGLVDPTQHKGLEQ